MAKGYKTGGRQLGTPEKRSAITENIEELLLREFNNIPAYLETLNEKEKLEFIVKLLPYTIPRYSHKTVDDKTPELPIFDQIQIVTSVDEKERLEKVEAYEKNTALKYFSLLMLFIRKNNSGMVIKERGKIKSANTHFSECLIVFK